MGILKAFHVLGAVVLILNLFFLTAWKCLANAWGHSASKEFAERQICLLHRTLTQGAFVSLTVAGIGMQMWFPISWSEPWFSVSVFLFVVCAVLWWAVILPRVRECRLNAHVLWASFLMLVLVIAAAVLMSTQPSSIF